MYNSSTSVDQIAVFLLITGSALMAADDNRLLFDFAKPDAAKDWQTVNDGVMGGVSAGQFKISSENTMDFVGTLSLENNGGFASVRSRPKSLELQAGDILVARVRGDGREYTLNLYVARPRTAFSYRLSFKTRKGEWIDVRAPLDTFVATSFGQVVPNEPLNPGEIKAIGFLLSDKKAGPFRLEVEWIKVKSGAAVTSAMVTQGDIAYGEHERHKLDVYAPMEGENHPVVFWIHGGG